MRFAVTVFVLLYSVTARQLKRKEYWLDDGYRQLMQTLATPDIEGVAKNVILFIGDGMGVDTVSAMRIYKGELAGKPGDQAKLSFDNFPSTALFKTQPTNALVADSASTASALLTGVKTRKSVISVDDRVVQSDCETYTKESDTTPVTVLAKEAGKAVGVVTNTRITHATPATAYGHSAERDWEDDSEIPASAKGRCKDLALQLIENAKDFDIVFGGGRRNFLTKAQGGRRTDGRDLIKEWKDDKTKRGLPCQYVQDRHGLSEIDMARTTCVLGLFAPSHLKYEVERKKDSSLEPSVSEMTEKAIRVLSKNPKGFFLLVEGGRIDHAHHGSKAQIAIREGLEFDRAVQKALDLTDPRDTLIIVTGDHGHVFNIAGYSKIETPLFGLSDRKADDKMPYTNVAYGNGPGFNSSWPGGRQNLTGVNTQDLNYVAQSAVPMVETHSADDVGGYALGPMAHLLRGTREQTYVAHVIMYAQCLSRYRDTARCRSYYANDVTRPDLAPVTWASVLMVIFGLR